MKNDVTTEERFENAIKNEPDRYIAIRNKDTNEIIEFIDRDTGILWVSFIHKGEKHWAWVV